MTLFEALYEPPIFFKLEDLPSHVEEVKQHIREQNAVVSESKEHLTTAQEHKKLYADKKRRGVQFDEGQLVYLKLRPYQMKSIARKLHEKLSPWFYGPQGAGKNWKLGLQVGSTSYNPHP